MFQRLKNTFNNGWLVSLGSGLILLYHIQIFNFILVLIGKTPIIIGGFWLSAQNFISSILNFQIKFWWLLILIIILSVGKILYKKRKPKVYEIDENYVSDEDMDKLHKQMDLEAEQRRVKKSKTLGYVNGKFLDYTWEWKWIENKKLGVLEPKYITPLCKNPKCDLNSMEYLKKSSIQSFSYHCSKCNRSHDVNAKTFKEIDLEIEGYIMEKVNTF